MLIQTPQQGLSPYPAISEVKLPLVIDERLVNRFKYWSQGVQYGMRHQAELYTYFQSYSVSDRLTAYTTAFDQAELNLSVCMTVSKTGYTVWVNLRSLNTFSIAE